MGGTFPLQEDAMDPWLTCLMLSLQHARNMPRFNSKRWGSWRMAFLLAKLQRELWEQAEGVGKAEDSLVGRTVRPVGRPKTIVVAPKKKGRPKASGKAKAKASLKASPKASAKATAKAKAKVIKASPKAKAPEQGATGLKRPLDEVPTQRDGVLGGVHRAWKLLNLGTESGRLALHNLTKDGFTVLRNVFDLAQCDLAVDKIWDFAMGRCPGLDPKNEATWTSDNWAQVVRGKNLAQLYGAGWVLWEERLAFRERLVELGVYADAPHHVSWEPRQILERQHLHLRMASISGVPHQSCGANTPGTTLTRCCWTAQALAAPGSRDLWR